jgi:hypothetical protein
MCPDSACVYTLHVSEVISTYDQFFCMLILGDLIDGLLFVELLAATCHLLWYTLPSLACMLRIQ